MKGVSYFILSAVALLFTVVSITSCDKDQTSLPIAVTPEQCPDTISFAGIVEPMIQQNCSTSGCHDAATSSGTYNLEGHGNISTHATDILNAINHETGVIAMPYFQPKLIDSIIGQFDCWIAQGTLDN
jgi:hypothetical protein